MSEKGQGIGENTKKKYEEIRKALKSLTGKMRGIV